MAGKVGWLEVAPDIFSIREKSHQFWQPSINLYFILFNDASGMIYDAGYAMKRSFNDFIVGFVELFKYLKKTGRLRADVVFHDVVNLIIVSHEHHDHASGLPYLRHYFPRAKACASAATAVLLLHQSDFLLKPQRGIAMAKEMVLTLIMNLFYRATRVQPSLKIDCVLHDGDMIDAGVYQFKVLLASGHAPSQLLLHDEQHGILITSDLILQSISTWLGPPNSTYEGYRQSMERIAAMNLNVMIPAHGKLIERPRERTLQLLKFRQLREDQIVETCANKPQSVGDIAWQTYRQRGIGTYLIARGMVNLVADYLVTQGRLKVIKQGRKRKYIRVGS
ncbi:MAG TPA: MBL fold metallo-hydrolase [Candidatus Lokiarchaeia archaeon]|nr:MBL fold metallo-hydrolase [Candidatus Lokiarchaeia archaeon]